jgi:hypothetical protein
MMTQIAFPVSSLPVVLFRDVSRFLRPVPRFVLHCVAFPEGTGFSDREGAVLGLAYSEGLFGAAPAWIEDIVTGKVEAFNVEEAANEPQA